MRRSYVRIRIVSGACAILLAAMSMLSSCMTMRNEESYAVKGGIYSPGVYTASAQGNIGPILVETTFSADAITKVRVLKHEETGVLSAPAIKRIPDAIVDGQTLAVDTLCGATYTSEAILDAVKKCIEQAGADVGLLFEPAINTQEGSKVILDADVVVVGAGLSGMCSAVSSAQEGLRVVVVEKLSYVGGSATSSLGSFMVCPLEDDIEKYGVKDSVTMDVALENWRTFTEIGRADSIYPNYAGLEKMLSLIFPMIEWLTELGASFSYHSKNADGTVKLKVDVPAKSEEKPGAKLIGLLSDRAAELGVIVLTDVMATGLTEDKGVVTGIKGTSSIREYQINCDNVILACGGFSSSPDLVAELVPEIDRAGYHSQSVSANTGDGLIIAGAVGAAIYEDNWVISSFISPSTELIDQNSRFLKLMEDNGLPEPYSSYDRMMVDRYGRRFMNEAASYSEQNIAMINNAAYPCYALYDSTDGELRGILESGLAIGEVFKGNTIGELADAAGMDREVLSATVERYSALAASGIDTDFGKPSSRMTPIAEEGPYYLVHFVNCFAGTLGGVKTDDNFRVLREDGSIIEGLFAVGEMANRLYFDRMYMSGASLSFGSAMGMQVGKFISENN